MLEASRNACPAPITRDFAGKPITFACELGANHSGDHQAAGLRWKISRINGTPIITERLTRKP